MSTPINELHQQIAKAQRDIGIEQFLKAIPVSFGPFQFSYAKEYYGTYIAYFYYLDMLKFELIMALPHNQDYLNIRITNAKTGDDLVIDQIKKQEDFAVVEAKWKEYWS